MDAPGSGPTAVGVSELVALLESSRDLALIVDDAGRIRWANEAARHFGRIESVDHLARAPHLLRAFLTQPAFRTVVREVVPALIAGSSWSGELDGLRPDGWTVPLTVAAVAHRRPDGSVESFSAIAHDLSSVREVVRSLGSSELRMRTLVEAAPIGIFETNAVGACTYVNPAFCRIAGVDHPDDALGLGWGSRVHPDDATRVGSAWATAVHLDTSMSAQFRFVTASGDVVWADVEAVPVHDECGRTTMFLGTIDDVTERTRLERDRYEAGELFRAAFLHAPTGMVLADVRADRAELVRCNEQYATILGRRLDELEGIDLADVTHPGDLDAVMAGRRQLLSGEIDCDDTEIRTLRPDGSWIWTSLTRSLVRDADGRPKYMLSQVADITAEKAAQARIEQLAFRDPLTSLPNRRAFVDRLETLLALPRQGSGIALLFIDLDHFKELNDGAGHEAGDDVLIAVARSLDATVRDGDIVARLGGDEFAVVLMGAGRHEMVAVAERVSAVLTFPRRLHDGTTVVVTASIGMAWARPDETVDDLLRRADHAMYVAKRDGRARLVVTGDVGGR